MELLPVTLTCFIHDPKAWINKWQKSFIAVGGGFACWATTADDAAAALAASTSSSKIATRVSIAGCLAEAVEGKLDGKQYALRLKLVNGAEVTGQITLRK